MVRVGQLVSLCAVAAIALFAAEVDVTSASPVSLRHHPGLRSHMARRLIADPAQQSHAGSQSADSSMDGATAGHSGMVGDKKVPKGPGPQSDGPPGNGTAHGHGHYDDDAKPRSALFSIMFFLFSSAALGALLYYFPVKKDKYNAITNTA